MGILESRTLDFKNVIMLSVNEGKLPKGKSVNSFIPYDMKKYFKLPTYAESDGVFAYHFYRLLQRAKNITLVYNSETDDFGSGEKSRFITQLLAEYKGDINEYVYKGDDLKKSDESSIIIENKDLDTEIKSWAKIGVSPSAINKYNNCSLSFYYHYLAKIRVDEEVDEYADASTMGTAIHDALDNYYPLGELTTNFIKENKKRILDDVKDNFESILSSQGMDEGKNYLSLKIAQKLTSNFLDLEMCLIDKANAENKQITILGKEKVLEHTLNFEEIEFKLSGKVDRVDLEGDQLRIIDYKTGKVERKEVVFSEYDELVDDPKKAKAFQLLMYAYLYLRKNPDYIGSDVVAGNFAFKNLNNGLLKVGKKIAKRESEVVKIDDTVLEKFEEQLKVTLYKILNDDFKQTTEVSNCEWCDYKNICRR
jgi:hypothetical protein